MKLSIGSEVIFTNDDGGIFAGDVVRFERDGHVAIIMPGDPVMKAWYPDGYQLGSAHWDARLTLINRAAESAGNDGPQAPTRAYALNEARRYLRNLVSASPKLGPNDAEVINIEQTLGDEGTLFLDLTDGTRIELKIRRYERSSTA